MARPTDPEQLAALRARQAANSRAYRARKRAEREAAQATPKRQPRAAPATEAAVLRAHEARAAAKQRRNDTIGKLTSARNPRVNIYTPREVPTTPASIPDTPAKRRQRIRVLRENTAAQKLQAVGRARKQALETTLRDDARADAIRGTFEKNPGGLARLQSALDRMSKVSQQTLAVFMQYEGGEGELQSALTLLAYPKGEDPEDQLSRIETLADLVERAEGLYGPKAAGRLRI